MFKNKLKKEIKKLSYGLNDKFFIESVDTLDFFNVYIKGPSDSPYSDGIFKLHVHIPDKYPFCPPIIKFITPIYHPNVNGISICLETLKSDTWSPNIGLEQLLMSIYSMMFSPNGESPLNITIGKQFNEEYYNFVEFAKLHTLKYAQEFKHIFE